MKAFFFIFYLFAFFVGSTDTEIDSLKTITKSSTDDFEVSKAYLQLAKLHERIDLKLGKRYALKAYRYKENDSLLAETNNQLGRFQFFASQLDSAAYYFQNTKTLLVTNKAIAQFSQFIYLMLGI